MIERVGDSVILVGTAHVSTRSVEEVERTIRETRPRQVHVELDTRRMEALKDPEAWAQTDIIKILREKKQHLFLLQLYLANFQARIGKETGSRPGAEMLRAMEVAEEVGADVVLIDRDIAVTMKRGFATMGFWQRLRLFWNVWVELLTPAAGRHDEAARAAFDIDDLLETDAITVMTEEFAQFAPTIKHALIDERDAYMASHVHEAARHGTVVAVVGAGHVPGMLRHLADPAGLPDRAALETVPRRRLTVGKVVAWLVPLLVIGGFAYMLATGDLATFRANAIYWILANGTLAAVGALVARGHPVSALVAFLAAPITSLNPTLAAGWFAGLAEAKLRTPRVADFQEIRTIETWKGFYRNGVVRVVLVTAFANLGSVLGSALGLTHIIRSLLGGG